MTASLALRLGNGLRGGLALARSPSRWLTPLLLALALLFGSFVVGVMLALNAVYTAALVSGILLLALGLLVPLRWLLVLQVLLVYLVVGQLIYFGGVGRAFWIPYLMGLLLYLRLVGLKLQQPALPKSSQAAALPPSAVAVWLLLFLACAVAASLISLVPPLQWFVAGKEYFLLWGVMLCLLARVVEPRWVPDLTRWIPWFLLLQVPVVVYQRFVVTPSRTGASVFDAVVGLFGGDPEGGGASGAMALFSMFVIALAIEGQRAGRLSAKQAWGWGVLALIPILLGEVKVVGMLLPLVLLISNGSRILRYPLRSMAGIAIGVMGVVALAWLYQTQFSYTKSQRERSITEYVEKIVERQAGGPLVSAHGEMGRIPALTYWWERQGSEFGARSLIGQGVGATRIGSLVVGEAAKQHRLRLGRSTLAVLLWEVGLIGAFAAVMVLVSAATLAWRMSREPAHAQQAWFLRSGAIGLVLVLSTFAYNTDFIETTPIKLLVMLLIGYVLALRRSGASARVQ